MQIILCTNNLSDFGMIQSTLKNLTASQKSKQVYEKCYSEHLTQMPEVKWSKYVDLWFSYRLGFSSNNVCIVCGGQLWSVCELVEEVCFLSLI